MIEAQIRNTKIIKRETGMKSQNWEIKKELKTILIITKQGLNKNSIWRKLKTYRSK